MALDTSMEIETFTFIWKIENFSHCLQKEGESLESPTFTVDSLNESRWCIKIYPKGLDKHGADEYFNFYLFCVDWKTCDFLVDFQLSLFATDGSIIDENKALAIAFDSNVLQCLKTNIYHQKDIYETNRSLYLPQDTLTVFCSLWKTNGDVGEHVDCVARSRLGVKQMTKLWNIQDFCKLKMGDESSQTVSFAEMGHTPMVLEVSLESFLTWIFLRIHINHEKCPFELLLSCTVSVLNRYKIPVREMQDKLMCLPNQDISWTFPKFISRRELMESQNDLLPQDTLSLKFEFTLSYGVEYERIESIHYGPPTSLSEDSIGTWWNTTEIPPDCPTSDDSEAKGSLKRDLLSFYQEQTESDFELRSEGVTFPVHKTILSARSPVFKAMFTCGMQEVTTNYLNVPDIDADTLTRMLFYVYTDTVEYLEMESASKLFFASDKYQILSLKQKCSIALKSNLTVHNVSVALVLADRHHDDDLTSAVQKFILNNDEEIIRSTEWLEFEKSDSHFAAKTMSEVYKKKLQIKS